MTPATMAAIHAEAFVVPRPWSAGEFTSMLQSPLVFVLCESQGFILGRVAAGEAEVLTLAVKIAARRQGNGQRLVTRFLAESSARGADLALLEVAADNPGAISLYLRAGFAETGRRAGYYALPSGAKVDALVLRRAL